MFNVGAGRRELARRFLLDLGFVVVDDLGIAGFIVEGSRKISLDDETVRVVRFDIVCCPGGRKSEVLDLHDPESLRDEERSQIERYISRLNRQLDKEFARKGLEHRNI